LTDSWTKGRAKGLHRETSPTEERATDPSGAARAASPQQKDAYPSGDVQHALQMLTLAQRTADEHVASAHRQADQIRADARATAEQIARDAQAQAEGIRRDSDKALSEARAQAGQLVRDAEAHAENARRNGDKIISEAQAQAAGIAEEAQASADRLDRLAQQRYEEMVGNLAAKREALQQQIEALQEFDRDYRNRLLSFMQAQLRALWVEEPRVDAEIEQSGSAATRLLPTQRPGSEATTESAPAPTDPGADPDRAEVTGSGRRGAEVGPVQVDARGRYAGGQAAPVAPVQPVAEPAGVTEAHVTRPDA
jgi:cell division septum initiation protein DivIVA